MKWYSTECALEGAVKVKTKRTMKRTKGNSWHRQSMARSFGPLHSEARLAFRNSNDFSDVSWGVQVKWNWGHQRNVEGTWSRWLGVVAGFLSGVPKKKKRIYGIRIELAEDIKCTRKSIHPTSMSGIDASMHRCMYIWVVWMIVRYPRNHVHSIYMTAFPGIHHIPQKDDSMSTRT